MTHWMQTSKTEEQLFLSKFWKLAAVMIDGFAKQGRENMEAQ